MNTTVAGHQANGGATKRGAPDPSVTMPDGVKAAAERANALMEQARVAKAANAAAGGDEFVKPAVVETKPNPNVKVANFDPNNPQPPQFEARTTPPPPATFTPPPPPPAPVTPLNEGDWEHQFRSLKGRFDREADEKKRLQQQVLDQQRLLAQVSPNPPAANEGSGVRFNVAPPPPGKRVTAAEVQEYTPELLDVMGRRAAEVYEPLLQQVVGELQQVKAQLGGVRNTVTYDASVRMYEDLAQAVPQWQQINEAPVFLNWLDQIDPISHRSRREFLKAAHANNVTGQVIDIFNAFLHEYNSTNNNGGAGVTILPPEQPKPAVDLMKFAAPGRPKIAQTTTPEQKEFIKTSEITQFYTEKTAGKWAGRDKEAADIEKRIFEAGNEGRIIRG